MLVAAHDARADSASPSTNGSRESTSPNVLLVVLDTLRADLAGEAPFLRRLAEQGRSFSEVYASSNWTLPSHVSLMSSLPYFEHNVPPPGSTRPFAGSRLADDQPTLAGVLRASGYATAASTEGGWVTPHHGLANGFDFFQTFSSPAAGKMAPPDDHLAFTRSFIQRAHGRPFFLFVHTYLVHDYFVNSVPYHELAAPEDAPFLGYGNLLEKGRTQVPPAFVRRLYASGVRIADRFLERLVEEVREETGDAPLLVVVTSDHGESLGEFPAQFGHGSRLNDLQTRIPLVVWSDVASAPRGVVDSLASTIDVAPSIVRWLGLPVPAKFRGRDDLLAAAPGPRSSPVVIQQYAAAESTKSGRIRHALIWNGYKYLRSDRLDGTNVSEACYPIPPAPDLEPVDVAMTEDCKPFRERFAQLLSALPDVSFVFEGDHAVEARLDRTGGPPSLAVMSAYPSATPILLSDRDILSWIPPSSGGWLVGYPRDANLSFSSIAVGGRTEFDHIGLFDLVASGGRAGSAPIAGGGKRFSVRGRNLEHLKRSAPQVDDGVRERLRALGYDER
jgi:arylsulfatase A-like enzyme